MIEIYVDNKALDIEPQGVTLQWKSFVFADAIGDQYTTDITLPRTANNTEILGLFGVLDGVTNFGKRIRCAVSVDSVGVDGYLQIASMRENDVTATLWLSPLPYDVIDRKVRDIVNDTSAIKEWDLSAPTSYNSGHAAGLQRSYFANDAGSLVCPWSLRLSEVLTAIGAAAGVTINLPFLEIYRIVASVPRVSPRNTRQVVYVYNDGGSPAAYLMRASQHVCTDVQSPRETVEKITVTRYCYATFTPYSLCGILINGVLVHQETAVATSPASAGTPYSTFLSAGDVIEITPYLAPANLDAVVEIQYSAYSATDEETDTLVFPGAVEGYNSQMLQVPVDSRTGLACDGNGGRVRLSWAYMDFWWCLGSLTVRELVNALCHLKGRGLAGSGPVVGFASLTETATYDCEVTEIRTASQSIGRTTMLAYNDKSERLHQETRINNEFIPDSAVLFRSVFFGAVTNAKGVARVPMFKFDDPPTYGVTWEDCGAVMLEEFSFSDGGGTRYALSPLGDMAWLGVDEATLGVEADLESWIDLRGTEVLHYEGRKYLVIEADTDTDTGLCRATALLCR